MTQPIATTTYRHTKKEGTYLFIDQKLPWEKLPAALQSEFSPDNKVVDFEMTPERKLARASGQTVYEALKTQGYYLQMPPSDPTALQQMEDSWVAAQQALLAKTSNKS